MNNTTVQAWVNALVPLTQIAQITTALLPYFLAIASGMILIGGWKEMGRNKTDTTGEIFRVIVIDAVGVMAAPGDRDGGVGVVYHVDELGPQRPASKAKLIPAIATNRLVHEIQTPKTDHIEWNSRTKK